LTYQIEFEPIGRRGACAEGKNLLECARYLGVGMVSICGGFGKCKACKVQVLKGQVSEVSSVEREYFSFGQLENGWRLACLTFPLSDCVLQVPPESLTTLQRMQVESRNIVTLNEPAVKAYQISMIEPALTDLRSDATRLLNSLEHDQRIHCQSIDIETLRKLSPLIREEKWQVTATVRENEVIAVNAVGSRTLGLAVDIGTTKIAGYLVDLGKGETLASKGVMNPQISYGEDITSRIHHALKSTEEAHSLQEIIISALDKLAGDLCAEIGAQVTDIVDSVVVGNTAIHHLSLGLPVYPLAYPPFVAAVQNALDIKARDLGLHLASGAYVHILPNIAGFVGADHVSMLVAIDALETDKLTLAIDIGTNTEVSLINQGIIFSASCASGPAFEGGHISCGMRAACGAIERLRIEENRIQYHTIGEVTPVGLCGSGIIDSIAQMYQAGILNAGGRMQEGVPGVRFNDSGREYVLVEGIEGLPPVVVTQRDVREVQLGKAAIRTGIQVLLDEAGCREETIQQVIIAGAFGTYIDIGNAIILGMLPFLPLERFQQIGNAAGLGARQTLFSMRKRATENAIAERMHYIELAGTPNFNKIFVQAQQLGQYRIKNGKRESII
jgi:uncharacterized 2Fe-2S/4Fe-4S cluster protein (DUF4445 family)